MIQITSVYILMPVFEIIHDIHTDDPTGKSVRGTTKPKTFHSRGTWGSQNCHHKDRNRESLYLYLLMIKKKYEHTQAHTVGHAGSGAVFVECCATKILLGVSSIADDAPLWPPSPKQHICSE